MGLGQKRLGWEGLGQKKIFFHGMGWDWDTNSKKMWDGTGTQIQKKCGMGWDASHPIYIPALNSSPCYYSLLLNFVIMGVSRVRLALASKQFQLVKVNGKMLPCVV